MAAAAAAAERVEEGVEVVLAAADLERVAVAVADKGKVAVAVAAAVAVAVRERGVGVHRPTLDSSCTPQEDSYALPLVGGARSVCTIECVRTQMLCIWHLQRTSPVQ